MSVQIPRTTLQKLTHESTEIRLRTLEQVEAKVLRAISHNQRIDFKPAELFKQLIRWFGHRPLQEPMKALRLLDSLLRSQYADQALEQIGLERIIREMGKVHKILHGRPEELEAVEVIQQQLLERKTSLVIEILDSPPSSIIALDSAGDVGLLESSNAVICCSSADYEEPWSKPTATDFNTMRFLADILVNPEASCTEVHDTLLHLQITMADFPAEYMLQIPNIYLNLLTLYGKTEKLNCSLEQVLDTVLTFLQQLKTRLHMRRKVLAYAKSTQEKGTLPKTQLKVAKALGLLFEISLSKLEILVCEFQPAVTNILSVLLSGLEIYQMQQWCLDRQYVTKVAHVCEKLKQFCAQENHFTLNRIKYLLFSLLLQDIVKNNVQREPLLDAHLLVALLKDYAFLVNFPERQKDIKKLLSTDKHNVNYREQILLQYEVAFRSAMHILKCPQSLRPEEILKKSDQICPTLEKLKSLELTKMLFDAIRGCNAIYCNNEELRNKAVNLLSHLLQLSHEPHRALVFGKLAQAIKKHFACLMEGENYCTALSNDHLLANNIIGVPLSTSLLLQLTCASYEQTNVDIRKHSEDILCLLLKSQHLLHTHWLTFVNILLPVLPLLQCCTHSPLILQHVLKLYDPDGKNLPFLTVLQGNIGFLYHTDVPLRSEALTRVIYMLNSLDVDNKYVPSIMKISDLLPNDLCLQSVPREVSRIFYASETYADLNVMHNLFAILETPDIEPIIRKTTLMQLNVLCNNWESAILFCKESAYYLAMQALENSLQKVSYADFTDAAIPAISILAKVVLCDAMLRQELAQVPNIYVLLLRALCLYQNNIQVRQDASTCLFLLLFASHVVVLSAGKQLQAPHLLGNLQLPLKCELTSYLLDTTNVQNPIVAQWAGIFESTSEENLYLRQLLAASHAGSAQKVNSKTIEALKQLDFNVELQLQPSDWRLFKSTNPTQNLKRLLKAMVNATDHHTLLTALITFKMQLLMQNFAGVPDVPVEIVDDLFNVLSRYIQQPPGNEADFKLYEQVLELTILCIDLQLKNFTASFLNSLQMDAQHACFTLLKNSEIPLRLYRKLCQLFALSFDALECWQTTSISSTFYSNLFELLFQVANLYFEQRDLQRVRLLLQLMRLLSCYSLRLSERELLYYCKRFLTLSISLRSFTQTGAQWQRDCLLLTCQLCAQMAEPECNFKLNASFLKYLSGLCGHVDAEVRGLAWVILSQAAHQKDETGTGFTTLSSELSYLPGGFVACCLSTFLDTTEVVLVRQLAGQLFVEMLTSFEEGSMLLEQHNFFRCAHMALSSLMFEPQLPNYFDYDTNAVGDITTCELLSCYCQICIKMLKLQADSNFQQQLCEKAFMVKLYEVLKEPPPVYNNTAYYGACADMCHLYALCYPENFSLLQRTMCHDQLWLMSFYQLLDQPYAEEAELVCVLQLLLVLLKDDNAYVKLCEKFAKAPEFVVKLCRRAVDVPHLGNTLQRATLAVLTLMLIKTQAKQECYDRPNIFSEVLEVTVEIDFGMVPVKSKDEEEERYNGVAKSLQKLSVNNWKDPKETQNSEDKFGLIAPYSLQAQRKKKSEKGLENSCPHSHVVTKNQIANNFQSPKSIVNPSQSSTNTVAVFIFMDLYRLFVHLYPLKACKFEKAPNAIKTQICDTLAMLLKLSTSARATARNIKLVDKIVNIFNTFFAEFNTTCSTFVRRYGEQRKLVIIKNFHLLFNMLLNWFTTATAVLDDAPQALGLSKVLIQIWPWLTHSADFKLVVLQVAAFLSERSLIVCQQFSALISNYAYSILQLTLKLVTVETTKVKASSSEEFPVISTGMRVLMNCCACNEGRVSLVKAHILDVFNGLYPFSLKSPKIKLDILISWLQFWEVFSRYPEGATVCHLNSLCAVINRSPPLSKTRRLSLKVLRNMCFLSANRSTLMTSTDFIYTVNEQISQPIEEAVGSQNGLYSFEEQFLLCVAIWKLISSSVKYVAMIRGTKLAKKFRVLRDQLNTLEEKNRKEFEELSFAVDLSNVLDIILNIFKNS